MMPRIFRSVPWRMPCLAGSRSSTVRRSFTREPATWEVGSKTPEDIAATGLLSRLLETWADWRMSSSPMALTESTFFWKSEECTSRVVSVWTKELTVASSLASVAGSSLTADVACAGETWATGSGGVRTRAPGLESAGWLSTVISRSLHVRLDGRDHGLQVLVGGWLDQVDERRRGQVVGGQELGEGRLVVGPEAVLGRQLLQVRVVEKQLTDPVTGGRQRHHRVLGEHVGVRIHE